MRGQRPGPLDECAVIVSPTPSRFNRGVNRGPEKYNKVDGTTQVFLFAPDILLYIISFLPSAAFDTDYAYHYTGNGAVLQYPSDDPPPSVLIELMFLLSSFAAFHKRDQVIQFIFPEFPVELQDNLSDPR